MTDASNSPTTGIGQLIPPPELAPGPPAGATRQQCVEMWFDLVEATDQIFLAALRSRCKSEAEVEAAYRESYSRWVEEHDRTVLHMFTVLNRRQQSHGG